MKAQDFLMKLDEAASAAGGMSLDILAQATAEALAEISGDAEAGEVPLAERTNDELREILAEMELPTSGNKDELVARIEAANAEAVTEPEA